MIRTGTQSDYLPFDTLIIIGIVFFYEKGVENYILLIILSLSFLVVKYRYIHV